MADDQDFRDELEKAAKKLDKWHADMMREYGWYSHFVLEDFEHAPNGVNIHTHGISASFDHPDFQICIPLNENITQEILANLVEMIKSGKKFSADEYYFDVIETWPITFIQTSECGRTVLRLIFPDTDGCLDPDEMKDPFKIQYQQV